MVLLIGFVCQSDRPIPLLGRRDHLQDRFHRPTAQGPGARRIGADARDRGHRVGGDVALASGPIQEARQRGLLAGAAGRAEPSRPSGAPKSRITSAVMSPTGPRWKAENWARSEA